MKHLLSILFCLCVLTSSAQTIVSGRVVAHQRIIPGAVIELRGTQRMAVTDSRGEFQIAIPDSLMKGTLLASYGGYADEKRNFRADTINVINMTTDTPIAVSRRNREKVYFRTAHRQIKKQLRQIK